MVRIFRLALVVSLAILCATRPLYPALLPNGDAYLDLNSGLNSPKLGHYACEDGKYTVNHFGEDFKRAKYRWTKLLCETDSDGDGVSNGAELGDPCCIFTQGDTPTRTTDLSFPGDPHSTPQAEENKICSKASFPLPKSRSANKDTRE